MLRYGICMILLENMILSDFCFNTTLLKYPWIYFPGLPQGLSRKESACIAGDTGDAGSILELGRSPGGGHGDPLQYSSLDRGAWRATVHAVDRV